MWTIVRREPYKRFNVRLFCRVIEWHSTKRNKHILKRINYDIVKNERANEWLSVISIATDKLITSYEINNYVKGRYRYLLGPDTALQEGRSWYQQKPQNA